MLLIYNICIVILIFLALIKHKDGWPFDRPITKAEVPDYHLHVKRPMDLGTIKYVFEIDLFTLAIL